MRPSGGVTESDNETLVPFVQESQFFSKAVKKALAVALLQEVQRLKGRGPLVGRLRRKKKPAAAGSWETRGLSAA